MWFKWKREDAAAADSRPVLAALKPGDSGVIGAFSGTPQLAQRMRELGLIEGARVQVMRVAPLGDPIQVRCGSFDVSLRRAEASAVVVESVERGGEDAGGRERL